MKIIDLSMQCESEILALEKELNYLNLKLQTLENKEDMEFYIYSCSLMLKADEFEFYRTLFLDLAKISCRGPLLAKINFSRILKKLSRELFDCDYRLTTLKLQNKELIEAEPSDPDRLPIVFEIRKLENRFKILSKYVPELERADIYL